MNVQADIRDLRNTIIRAGVQCERMLKAADHPLNADVRDEFLDRANYWSNAAARAASELHHILQRVN